MTAEESNLGATLFLSLLILMAVMATFASDLYAPSLPAIAHSLHTTGTQAKYTITVYLLGFALAQVLYGPLSDAYGRRFAVLLGLLTFVIGSILCVCAHSITMLCLGRLIQGLGAAGILCIARIAMGDLLSGARLSQVVSYFSMLFAVVPVIAPIVGATIQHYYHWPMVFILMLSYSVIALVVIFLLFPETNNNINRSAIQPRRFLKNYWTLLTNTTFWSYAASSGAIFGGIMAYYTVSPFLFEKQLHVSVLAFGWITFLVACGLIVGRIVNARIIRKYSALKLLTVGIMMTTGAALLMLIFAILGIHTVAAIIIPMFIYLMATGFIFANAFVGVITAFPHMKGATGALYSGLQMLISFGATLIAANISIHPQLTIAVIISVLSAISIIFLALGERTPVTYRISKLP